MITSVFLKGNKKILLDSLMWMTILFVVFLKRTTFFWGVVQPLMRRKKGSISFLY